MMCMCCHGCLGCCRPACLPSMLCMCCRCCLGCHCCRCCLSPAGRHRLGGAPACLPPHSAVAAGQEEPQPVRPGPDQWQGGLFVLAATAVGSQQLAVSSWQSVPATVCCSIRALWVLCNSSWQSAALTSTHGIRVPPSMIQAQGGSSVPLDEWYLFLKFLPLKVSAPKGLCP